GVRTSRSTNGSRRARAFFNSLTDMIANDETGNPADVHASNVIHPATRSSPTRSSCRVASVTWRSPSATSTIDASNGTTHPAQYPTLEPNVKLMPVEGWLWANRSDARRSTTTESSGGLVSAGGAATGVER